MNGEQSISTASKVARLLVELAESDRDDDQQPMTNMRLQKLLYYVQGWALARLGRPAFGERIEAWEHGPVVPPIYGRLKHNERGPIPASDLDPADDIDADLRAFVASVWADYRVHSAIRLRRMTHDEAPWKDAYAKRERANHCDEVISNDELRAFFEQQAPKGVTRYRKAQPDSAWFDEPSPFPETA